MPITWDPANSMQMLLLVIAEADVKPTTAIWTRVASKLGDITPSAVRYDMGTRSAHCCCSTFQYLQVFTSKSSTSCRVILLDAELFYLHVLDTC